MLAAVRDASRALKDISFSQASRCIKPFKNQEPCETHNLTIGCMYGVGGYK